VPDSGEEEEQRFWQSGQSEATTVEAGHKRVLHAHLLQFTAAVFFLLSASHLQVATCCDIMAMAMTYIPQLERVSPASKDKHKCCAQSTCTIAAQFLSVFHQYIVDWHWQLNVTECRNPSKTCVKFHRNIS
jgi:hypothetical protein